ncbi:MAG: fibrillarin-like rRNA/tRNA 2'-O-methyltransferase [Methanomicrobiales archaeon]|nr:fibrillarin-like rRNA/tRNA 2'-O-methyltransferase [Methanomicrobiales archaeon]
MKWLEGNLVSPGGKSLYGERMCAGYRVWDPRRSKLAALIVKDPDLDFTPEMQALYLGGGHGTTVSHLADYLEVVYAVEIAPRPFQDLLRLSRGQENIIPLMADAGDPAFYAPFVERVDLLYQDVAHPSQAEIALRNRYFLKPGGTLILMLKTACVDSTMPPEQVFTEAVGKLQHGYRIVRTHWLDPYFPAHAAIVAMVSSTPDRV